MPSDPVGRVEFHWRAFAARYADLLATGADTHPFDRARNATLAALYAPDVERACRVLEAALAGDFGPAAPLPDRTLAKRAIAAKGTEWGVDAERAMLALADRADAATAALLHERIATVFAGARRTLPTYELEDTAVRVELIPYHHAGLLLRGLIMAPAVARPRGLVAYVHGGLLGLSPPALVFGAALATRGFAVALPELRGQGGSQGLPEFIGGEVDDTLEMVERVRAHLPNPPPGEAYVGDSTGLPVALLAAARRPSCRVVSGYAGPVDPVGLCEISPEAPAVRALRVLIGQLNASRRPVYEARSAVGAIRALRCPGVVFWGAQDDAVPLEQAIALQVAARDARAPLAVTVYGDQPHSLHQQTHGRTAAEDAWDRLLRGLDRAFG